MQYNSHLFSLIYIDLIFPWKQFTNQNIPYSTIQINLGLRFSSLIILKYARLQLISHTN